MNRLKKWVVPLGLILNDAGMIYLSFYLAFNMRFFCGPFLSIFPASKGTPDWIFYQDALRIVIPLWILVFSLWGKLYYRRFTDAADEFMGISKGVVLGTMLIVAATFLYRQFEYSRLVMGLSFFFTIITLFISRVALRSLLSIITSRWFPPEKTLILGQGKGMDVISKLIQKQRHHHSNTYSESELDQAVNQIRSDNPPREVFVAGQLIYNPKVLEFVDECEDRDIEIKILPDFLEMRMGEIMVDDSLRIPILHLKPLSLHGFRYFVKRLFDVTLSIIIVSLSFFPFLILSFLVVIDSKGGIFFTQDRVGFKEKIFKCLKFRTMHQDAEAQLEKMKLESFRGGPAFKMKGDPRITRVGKWIRKFSLDECGQIWNVLKGDMSLIGPRPQVLAEANGNPDWAKKRYRILPGITGLWQVSGRADLPYEEMMRLDIYYLENWSPGLDLKILLKTLPVIISGRGAY